MSLYHFHSLKSESSQNHHFVIILLALGLESIEVNLKFDLHIVSIAFGPYITFIASNPKTHKVIDHVVIYIVSSRFREYRSELEV